MKSSKQEYNKAQAYQRYKNLEIEEYISYDLYNIIKESWTEETENKEKNIFNNEVAQSQVTSLLIHDLFGGKIMKYDEYYYNIIGTDIIDIAKEDIDYIYIFSEQITKDEILKDKDTKERYKIFLTNIIKNIRRQINREMIEENINFLNKLQTFSTFEIDNYNKNEDEEQIEFGLTDKEPNNIRYKHSTTTDEYQLCEMQLMYAQDGIIISIPQEVIEKLFKVARNNREKIKVLKQVRELQK